VLLDGLAVALRPGHQDVIELDIAQNLAHGLSTPILARLRARRT
jgi:hypothetical protein